MPWKKKILDYSKESTVTRNGKIYPLFYCKEVNGQWIFACRYCNQYHSHGIGPGHYASHCISKELKNGYFLCLEGEIYE